MKKDKHIFIIILISLTLFIPLSIYGTYLKLSDKDLYNESKEFYYEGKLHFYKGDALEGTYTCKTENCTYASAKEENVLKTSSYVFIQDGNEIILYDYKLENNISVFEDIKISEEKNIVLVLKNSLWGALSLKNLSVIVPYLYTELFFSEDYTLLGIKDNNLYAFDELYESTLFKEDGMYSQYFNDYIVYKNEYYEIYKLDKTRVLPNFTISYIVNAENYYGVVYNNYLYIYNNLEENFIAYVPVSTFTEINFEIEETLKVIIDDQVVLSVEF